MLVALMDGRALPAGQLAMIANVAPQTASSHLAKLVDGRLLTAEQQGRHRYYRLANAEVGHAVEALMALSPRANGSATKSPVAPNDALAYARTCYSHLAGRLAIGIADALQERQLLVRGEDKLFSLTAAGRIWFAKLGIELRDRDTDDPRFAKCCLDWTERRHHIAGRLGSAMLLRFRELKWIAPLRNTRAVRVTLEGERKFWELLRVNGNPRSSR